MMGYVRWSLWQFYLLFFCPTQFRLESAEFEAGKDGQLKIRRKRVQALKLLPWTIVFGAIGNQLLGLGSEQFGFEYDWGKSWMGVGGVVVAGLALAVGLGSSSALAVGTVLGLVSGVAGAGFGLGEGVASGVAFGVAFGAAFGVGFGIADFGYTAAAIIGAAVVYGAGFGSVYGNADSIVPGGLAGGVAVLATRYRLLTYPFLVICNWLAFKLANLSLDGALRFWRLQPAVWHEVIWLPQPFLAKHLALVIQADREYGFQQLAFIAAERSLQKRAIPQALGEVAVADVTLGVLEEVSAVSDRLKWADDSPAALPEDVRTALPRFRRVSEHVAQCEELKSGERKQASLQRAADEVEQLQRSLSGSRGKFAPRLLSAANHWAELIGAELDRFKAARAESRLLPNPFVFGPPVGERNEEVFTGRRDIVEHLEASVLGATNIPTLLMYGARRMGKSSILKQLPRLLGPNFAVAEIDCQRPAVTESIASVLAMLTRAISTSIKRWQIDVIPLGRPDFADSPFGVFDDWLDQVDQAIDGSESRQDQRIQHGETLDTSTKRKRVSSDHSEETHSLALRAGIGDFRYRVLWCLDEFERLQEALDAGWGDKVLDQLRHTLQHRSRFVLLFCGSHTFEECGPAWTDRFISARRLRVSYLPREDLVPLLTRPCADFDLTYEPGALDAALDATAGQPFLTQAVGFELVQFLNETERKIASIADIEEAVTRALFTGSEYFVDLWNKAGDHGQAVLNAIVRGEPIPDDARTIRELVEHDVLNDEQQFIVPMMERWVRERV